MGDQVLFTSRIHPKILFVNGLIQVGLLLGVGLVVAFYPSGGDRGVQAWGPWVLALVFLGLEVVYVVVPVLRWWCKKFTVTSTLVKDESGIVWKKSKEIDLHRIVSITEERGLLDRIFGCGTLIFFDAASQEQSRGHDRPLGRGNTSGLRFHDVPKVHEVKELIERARTV